MDESTRSHFAVALNGYGLPREDGGADVLPWRELVGIVETAEEVGYEAVFTPEIGAREGFATLAGLAGVTSRVRLATGVLPIAARDPRRTAMGAATLHDLSGGRFVLGLGSSGSIEETAAYLSEIRALLTGEGSETHGALDLLPGRVPLFLAALGPRMAGLAGRAADGVILNWCTPERVARARREIAQGAEAAGRDAGAVEVAVYVRSAVGHEEQDAVAALGETAAGYAAMPKYRRQFEAMGLGEEAAKAATGSHAVPEGLLRAVCAWGDRTQTLARLSAYLDAGADLVVVYPVPILDAATSTMGTVLGLAPHPAVER